jgi:hypothetical protein
VPLSRILFVVDECRTEQEWESAIRQELPPTDSQPLQLAAWPTGKERLSAFRKSVVEFANALPESPVGEAAQSDGLQRLLGDVPFIPAGRGIGFELIVGLCLGGLISVTNGFLARLAVKVDSGVLATVMSVFATGYILLTAYFLIAYVRDCVSQFERVKSSIVFGILLVLPYVYTATANSAIAQAREAAGRTVAKNNLKQISLSMYDYYDDHGRLPAANAASDDSAPNAANPAVSWRVKLLPLLLRGNSDDVDRKNIEATISGYRMNEAWDSPHNSQFISKIPARYVSPEEFSKAPHGYTHYCVFVKPATAEGPSPVWHSGGPGPRLQEIVDGTSRTILIVEAAEAIPWTCPNELSWQRNGAMPRLGGIFTEVYHAAMVDGSIRAFRNSTPESELEALITADGNETIVDD